MQNNETGPSMQVWPPLVKVKTCYFRGRRRRLSHAVAACDNPRMRRAKIVATIGPASEAPERLAALVAAGMDVARINMSHGAREHHVEVIRRVREAAAAAKRPVAVLADLSGPKIRTGRLSGGGPVTLEDGAVIRLVAEEIEGTAETISISYTHLAEEVRPGDRVLVDDGLIELRIEAVEADTVVARVVHGGPLNERKGVNLPGVRLSVPSITDKDRADLAAVLPAGIDYVGLSFVRQAADCRLARELVDAVDPGVRLVAKIEKPEAINDLSEILSVTDGVMVARGDLGVEASPEAVPIYQKRIIASAIRAERFVITATQMLQSMVDQPRPTRAEASDVANAIFDGTDAVMLSGETAAGRYPVEAVETMDRIVRFAESAQPRDENLVEQLLGVHTGTVGRALAEASLFAAEEIAARTIVVFTQGGGMARHMASLRPRQRIVALTPTERLHTQLAVLWGVEPYRMRLADTSDALLTDVDRALIETGSAERGEMVVLLVGTIEKETAERIPASTMLKLHRVGDLA
jgi:pyruvate kinase